MIHMRLCKRDQGDYVTKCAGRIGFHEQQSLHTLFEALVQAGCQFGRFE